MACRMSKGGEELSLLQIDRTSGGGGRDDQIRLPAQERRDLQHVGDFGHRRGLRRLVDVGQDGAAEAPLDRRQHVEAARQSRAPERRQ